MVWQFQLHLSQQRIERNLYKHYMDGMNNHQSIDVVKIFNFERSFVQFQREVISTASKSLNFWKLLLDKRLDVNKVHEFGIEISNSNQQVDILYKQLRELFPDHLLLQKVYSLFQRDVMNNEQLSQDIASQVRVLQSTSLKKTV